MNNAKMGTALIGGYLLGRTKKGKLALGLAMALAGSRVKPAQLGKSLAKSPILSHVNQQVRGELMSAGKAAATTVLNAKAEHLADALHGRTAGLRDGQRNDDGDDGDEGDEGNARDDAGSEPEGRRKRSGGDSGRPARARKDTSGDDGETKPRPRRTASSGRGGGTASKTSGGTTKRSTQRASSSTASRSSRSGGGRRQDDD
ncbi:ABC transporter substrate-binding protein [Streptomyces sp. NPDC048018]|uniref:ABC transporter substrate-binding protein n=1 Tax=Streptomyces sp. NPDC048018 TaxID=3365499 RepID=UPI0037203ADC